MAAVITKELALRIASKIDAQIRSPKNRRHDIAAFFYNGKLICSFGIRRGSSKEMGHDYIPGQIYLSQKEAKLLGQCPMSKEDWIEVLKKKGKLPT